jgi:hypothetical protein
MKTKAPLLALFAVTMGVGVYAQIATAGPAGAAPVASARASTSALASGSALPPTPAHIDASEHVDGVFVAPMRQRPNAAARYFAIVATEDEARTIAAGGAVDVSARTEDTCFGYGASTGFERPSVTVGIPVPGASASSARPGGRPAPPRPPPPPPQMVRIFHVVRTVVADGHARLETSVVWADLSTGGSRLASHHTQSFSLVAHGPNGFDVYSAPELNGEGTKFLVVTPPLRDEERAAVAQVASDSVQATGCGHLEVRLKAHENGGQMANVTGVVELPPDPNDDGTGAGDDGSQSGDGTSSAGTAPRPRLRPVRANLSVSRVASDSQPVVTVSFSWAGPDHAVGSVEPASSAQRFIE